MHRSGLILGVSGPAVLLTLLLLPSVRSEADRWRMPKAAVPTVISAPTAAPAFIGAKPVSLEINPIRDVPLHYATMPRPEARQVRPWWVRRPARKSRSGRAA